MFKSISATLFSRWGIMQPEEYAIQFSDSNKQQIYITERV